MFAMQITRRSLLGHMLLGMERRHGAKEAGA
jgi:hypothetical protein